MAICDVLIAVDNVNKDIISEAIYEVSHSVEVCDGHTFFTFKSVEVDLTKDLAFVSISGALDELGTVNYALAIANNNTKSLVLTGSPYKYGIQAILSYGTPSEQNIH